MLEIKTPQSLVLCGSFVLLWTHVEEVVVPGTGLEPVQGLPPGGF